MEKLSLIDMSSDDDLLHTSTDQCDQDLRCSEKYNDHEEVNHVKVSNQCDPVPKMSDSPEQKRAKSGKVNLRKSLAWDNAFFTSEGVLNSEELGIVNSSFRKTGACSLSGIPEELRKSSESTSTLDSDSYSLASLEGDLFNLRASIQMTVGRYDDIASVEPTPSCLDTEKGVQVPIEKAKPPIALRKVGINKQQTDHTSKGAVTNEAKKGTDNLKLALKPPRMVPKSTSLSMHSKDSSASLQMKLNAKRTSSAVGSISKTNVDSGNKTPGSVGLSKPKPLVKSLISTSTTSLITSPRENSRKRLATRNTDNSLSKQTAKTPTRTSKSRLGSSNHSTNFPPKSSPSSSTDSFASEVSSSSTSISISSIKPSNSVESFTSSNSSSPSIVSNKHVSPNNVQRRVPNVKASLSFNSVPETSSKDNGTRASTNSNTGAKSFIPTGLRMPSPKIGYFDSEKSQVNKSTKIPHSDLRRSSMSKGTPNNTNIGANKAKSLKIPSLKAAPKPTLVGSDSPYTRPSPIYKEDTHIENERDSSMSDEVRKENELNSSTLDKVQKEKGLDASKSDKVQNENELNSSTLDKVKKENGFGASKSDKMQKENELNSSALHNVRKENLFPLCDTNELNHDSMLEKMTALSISTRNDSVTDT